jgi:SAM-dependent methyltransferase
LELACGTGEVARELVWKKYKVTGLDINEKMLEKAEKNLDKKNLVLWDMTNFDLNKSFDTILCNYNSICHLLKWVDWQNFFKMSANHLKKDWLLVFDINTLYEFENITKDFAQFYNFGNDTVCLEMNKRNWIFEWIVKIFKKNSQLNSLKGEEKNNYELIEEVIKENSFPINKIKKELKEKWFEILEMIDYHYWEVTASSERVYFICKKK